MEARAGSAFVVAILAGGRGRRLGGTPKALVAIGGRTLLERALDSARSVSDEVLVSASARLGLAHPGARLVEDAVPNAGPLGGLVAVLEAAPRDPVVVQSVDLALATPELLRALAAALHREAASVQAVVPRNGGLAQPLAAAYRRSAAPALRRALESGARSLVAAVETLAVRWLDGEDVDRLPGGRDALLNVNTPEDLERARARLAALEGNRT